MKRFYGWFNLLTGFAAIGLAVNLGLWPQACVGLCQAGFGLYILWPLALK